MVWVDMEQHSARPVSLASLVCAPLPLSKKRLTNNPIVSGSLRIWAQFRVHFKYKQALITLPLTSNALFTPSLIDAAFEVWAGKGCKRVKDLFEGGVFMSFEQLVDAYGLPRSHFFRYLQVRDFVKKYFDSFPRLRSDGYLVEWLEGVPNQRGMVSMTYNDIREMASPSLDHIREAWSKDIGVEVPEDVWHPAITRIHSSSICIRHGLLQFKVLHRLHFSKSRLAEIYPDVDPTCSRCHQAPATLSAICFGHAHHY